MKIGACFVLLLLLLPVFSAVTIDMKQTYNQGEIIIAKVTGAFVNGLKQENVFFYRERTDGTGMLKIPIDYDVGKIGNDYYIVASLIGKTQNNYSVIIKNTQYYEGGQIKNTDIEKDFKISSDTATFAVTPGFIFTNKNFTIKIKGLLGSITVSSNSPSGISSPSSSLVSGQTKELFFDMSGITSTVTGNIQISSGSLTYTVPIYVLYISPPEPPAQTGCTSNSSCGDGYFCNSSNECEAIIIPAQPYCGDGEINSPGELCDGSDISGLSCASYGFNAGTISCNPPGSTTECKIDTSNCKTQSTVQCTTDLQCSSGQICDGGKCITSTPEPEDIPCGDGSINPGELCDGITWGAISGCGNFGFDKGTLTCTSSCTFDTSQCSNNEVIEPPQQCSFFNRCQDGYDCDDSGQCVPEPPPICVYDTDCGSFFTCDNQECVIKPQCEENNECNDYQICQNNRCTFKQGDECLRDIDCEDKDYECVLGFCNKIIECKFNSECKSEKCVDNKCVPLDECKEDIDCDKGESCDGGKCVIDECDVDTACHNGYECESSRWCVEKTKQCTSNSNCNLSTEYCSKDNLCLTNFTLVNKTVSFNVNQACAAKSGEICTGEAKCSGDYDVISGTICCTGECKVPGESSPTNKIIGWAIIAVIGIFILWFFKKFKSKTTKTPTFLRR